MYHSLLVSINVFMLLREGGSHYGHNLDGDVIWPSTSSGGTHKEIQNIAATSGNPADYDQDEDSDYHQDENVVLTLTSTGRRDNKQLTTILETITDENQDNDPDYSQDEDINATTILNSLKNPDEIQNVSTIISANSADDDDKDILDYNHQENTTHQTSAPGDKSTVGSLIGTNTTTLKKAEGHAEFSWLEDALKDIAYYLRAHKFNEYDRRYQPDGAGAPRGYFGTFPRPPLRALHWEVHKFCEPSFLACVEYLARRIKHAGLKRTDDTAIVIQEQQWGEGRSKQIDAVEKECRKMLNADNVVADPFQGPLERFQWRTTASYYMCWYTMNEVSELQHLKESCDNFAHCLDPDFGVHNHDPRANDMLPYACALYSFCPDPCCPTRYLGDFGECSHSPSNPCSEGNSGRPECAINRSQNTDFGDIVLNRWNVTCTCPDIGYEWDSKYGMCVDVDECLAETHRCDPEREACVNLPGSFRCACKWGFSRTGEVCEPSSALRIISSHNKKPEEERRKKAGSLVKKLFHRVLGKSDGCRTSPLFALPGLIAVSNFSKLVICVRF